jgi:uncharacterized protein (TIGR02996 family)
MHDETDFLGKLLENPADDTVRLVYADWLDERGDKESRMRANFLRVTVRVAELSEAAEGRPDAERELQELAQSLPPAWLAVTSRLKVEACATARIRQTANELLAKQNLCFNVVCDRRWEDLAATDDEKLRFCGECKKHVHYCDTIEEARSHAHAGECVAVNLGVIRHENDLEWQKIMLGGIGLI